MEELRERNCFFFFLVKQLGISKVFGNKQASIPRIGQVSIIMIRQVPKSKYNVGQLQR